MKKITPLFLNDKSIWKNANIILRIWCGIIFIYYGTMYIHPDKIQGFANWLQGINIPFPLFSAYLSKVTEIVGGIFLIIGFLTRPTCFLLSINIAIATFVAEKGDVFDKAIGPFLILLIVIVIFLSEQSSLSVDNVLLKRMKKNT